MTARQSPLLVLDEPLSMLDSTAALDLVAYLADLVRGGTTVIVCEHRGEYLMRLPGLRTLPLSRTEGEATERQDALAGTVGVPALPGAARTPCCLDVSGLRVQLGERSILNGVSFLAQGGQVVAIVGRNGVGKTTLMRSLAGLQRHEGTVTLAALKRAGFFAYLAEKR